METSLRFLREDGHQVFLRSSSPYILLSELQRCSELPVQEGKGDDVAYLPRSSIYGLSLLIIMVDVKSKIILMFISHYTKILYGFHQLTFWNCLKGTIITSM